jgi:toxin FitB
MVAARRPSIGPFSPRRSQVPSGEVLSRFWRRCRRSASTRISSGSRLAGTRAVYLIDTNVISEARKGDRANRGVVAFLKELAHSGDLVFLASVTIGELRRGVELIRRRGDANLAERLEAWLESVVEQFGERILSLGADAAQVWGRLRVPNPDHALDKQIAAIALVNDLTLATRNVADFQGLGVRLRSPFSAEPGE